VVDRENPSRSISAENVRTSIDQIRIGCREEWSIGSCREPESRVERHLPMKRHSEPLPRGKEAV
jgi:hypothetical protein